MPDSVTESLPASSTITQAAGDDGARHTLRLGVAGPVGTGKSSLIALICRELAADLSIGVITNDIYTDEDARFLRSAGVLDPVVATGWVIAAGPEIERMVVDLAGLTDTGQLPAFGAPQIEQWAEIHATTSQRLFRA